METSVVDRIQQATALLAEGCHDLDPDTIDPADVAVLHQLLVRVERLAIGARTRLARRVADTGVWKTDGAGSPAAYLATTAGTTLAEARQQLVTSEDLPHHPHLDAALEAGALSAAQTRAITPGLVAAPEAEADLVGRAADGRSDLTDLRRRSRELVAAADPDPDATRARHQRRRSLRTWTEPDGEWHAHLQGPAEAGAAIEAALMAGRDAAFKAAHAQGRREPAEAYAFDGLLEAVTRTAAPRPATTTARKAIGIVDVAAFRRGHLAPGDTCRLAGIGPVSLSAMREFLGEATVAVLFRRGTVDLAVAHLGRQPTAFQRSALEARDTVCAVDGCGRTQNLEIDHTKDWATTGITRTADLDWLCRSHHRAKTTGQLTLSGPPGNRIATPTARSP